MNDTRQQAPPPPPSPPSPPAPPPPPPPPPPGTSGSGDGWNTEHLADYRLLRRSHHDKKLGGVAGGLGRHLDIDPTILRVLFVVTSFFGGAGLLIYTALWLVVPDDVTGRSVISVRDGTRNVVVIAVLVIAAFAAVGDTLDGGSISWPPLVIIALVTFVWLMARDRKHNRPSAAAPLGPQPPYGSQPVGSQPVGSQPAGVPSYPPSTPPLPPAVPVEPWRPRRSGPLLFGVTAALIALALGGLGVYAAADNTVADAAYPALAMGITGVMLVVGALVGRPGGLILLGALCSVVLLATSVSQPGFSGDRDLQVRPSSASELESSYSVPAGRIEVDLRGIRDREGLDGSTLDLSANAGEIVLIAPRDLTVNYRTEIDYAGAVDIPDGVRGGVGVTWDGSLDGRDPVAEIDVDANLHFGHIELRQP